MVAMPRVNDEFLRDLNGTHALLLGGTAEQRAVDALEAVWTKFETVVENAGREYDDLFRKLEDQGALVADPARLAVDLLGVVGRIFDEVVHTRVIAKLLGPDCPRQRELLRALVLGAAASANGDLRKLDASRQEFGKALSSSWSIAVEPEKRGAGGRPDIVVTLSQAAARMCLVIENKIHDEDRENQLDGYRRWALAQKAQSTLLVYLTPGGDEPCAAKHPGDWSLLSYRPLSYAWRIELPKMTTDDDRPWAELLRLYLATVMRHVLKERVEAPGSETMPVTEKVKMIAYLQRIECAK